MIRFAGVVFSVLIAAIVGQSQTGETGQISGSVTYEKAPVGKAFIYLHSFVSQDSVIKPDEHGHFSMKLRDGYYYLFVAAPGFQPSCEEFRLEANKKVELRLKLKPSKLLNDN